MIPTRESCQDWTEVYFFLSWRKHSGELLPPVVNMAVKGGEVFQFQYSCVGSLGGGEKVKCRYFCLFFKSPLNKPNHSPRSGGLA